MILLPPPPRHGCACVRSRDVPEGAQQGLPYGEHCRSYCHVTVGARCGVTVMRAMVGSWRWAEMVVEMKMVMKMMVVMVVEMKMKMMVMVMLMV